MSRSLNRISRGSYRFARATRDWNAVARAGATGSLWPIVRRIINRVIGRTIVRRLWLR